MRSLPVLVRPALLGLGNRVEKSKTRAEGLIKNDARVYVRVPGADLLSRACCARSACPCRAGEKLGRPPHPPFWLRTRSGSLGEWPERDRSSGFQTQILVLGVRLLSRPLHYRGVWNQCFSSPSHVANSCVFVHRFPCTTSPAWAVTRTRAVPAVAPLEPGALACAGPAGLWGPSLTFRAGPLGPCSLHNCPFSN